jgi:hypothetical protein
VDTTLPNRVLGWSTLNDAERRCTVGVLVDRGPQWRVCGVFD